MSSEKMEALCFSDWVELREPVKEEKLTGVRRTHTCLRKAGGTELRHLGLRLLGFFPCLGP